MREFGPNPGRVHELAGLARELDLLRARAAAGTLKPKVSLEDLTRLVRMPRSTLHRYVTGQTLVPSEVLDRIVIALGASPAEQRDWNEAWYRVHATPVQVPNALPATIRGFVGRTAELAGLDRSLASAEPGLPILAVSGPPGVGKTALAVHWAHRARSRFPDGCLYVDLRGYSPDPPLEPSEALGTVLGCLGDDGPADAAHYRSRLAGRRMLVVLDNALCAEQVRPLLPGSGSSAVIVTSRDDLAGLVAREGAHRISLDPLPQPEALALLGNLLGENLPAATVLAHRCGGLPLALRVAAEAWDTSLADVSGLDWLDAGGDPRTGVRAVFSWSYRRLVPEAAALFRLLGRHSGGDLTGLAGHRLVRTLERAHLVRTSSGRYRMHRLLRAYAAELSD
ncbi:helix-turn-helix domain-containing protein [Lentzea sp. NPDC051838]|uniref:helix-turn-helix domain-containing protein n=1 Tax=Lentzea sp. NPDC051838 TaxID=3154849 RepID=UPI00343228AB